MVLLARRDEAIMCYQEVLQTIGDTTLCEEKIFGIQINKQWLEECLETPFEWILL